MPFRINGAAKIPQWLSLLRERASPTPADLRRLLSRSRTNAHLPY